AVDKYTRNMVVNERFNKLFSAEGVCLASGEGFADALAGSALAAKLSQPIILINPALSGSMGKYYQRPWLNLDMIMVFGGTEVISDKLIQYLQPSDAPSDPASKNHLDETNLHLLPPSAPSAPNQKVGEIIITSTRLGIAWGDGISNDMGYATYIVKDQDGRDITNTSLAANLKATSNVGIAATAYKGLLKVDFGPNLDAYSLTGVTVTITDPQTGVTATESLEIVSKIRVISP
ncbi:MAG: cell wall-binding repeat-containing protein, partial [Desulfitobacterium hafniense]